MAVKNDTPYGVVYFITNQVNGKGYVGQTTDSVNRRWKAHCAARSRCCAIAAAIRKHGDDAFKIEVVATAFSRDELNKFECEAVERLGTLSPNGYNIKEGGGSKGKWSAEGLESLRRAKADLQYRERAKRASTVMWCRPETRQKISASIRIGLADPAVKAKRSVAAKEACLRPDVLAKMSAAQKERFGDKDQRRKISEQNKERCADPAYRLMLKETALKRSADPAFKAKISASIKVLWEDPIYRARMIAAQKAGKEKKRSLTVVG